MRRQVLQILVLLFLPFLGACTEITMQGDLLSDYEADAVAGISQYYKYEPYIWSKAKGSYIRSLSDGGAIYVRQIGKSYYVNGGPKKDQYKVILRAKHVSGSMNGQHRFVVQKKQQSSSNSGKSNLYVMDVNGSEIVTYVNVKADAMKNNGRLKSYPFAGHVDTKSGLIFDSNVSQNNKQDILTFMASLDGQQYFSTRAVLKPITQAEAERIWAANKAREDAKKAQENAKKLTTGGAVQAPAASQKYNGKTGEPTEPEIYRAVMKRFSETGTGKQGMQITRVSKFSVCSYVQKGVYRCSYKVHWKIDCQANPSACAVGGTTQEAMNRGVFTRMNDGSWYFGGAE